MTEATDDTARLLRRAIWLSFWIGALMLLIKVGAWWLTRSAAILGDAAESVIHVLAVAFVVYSLRLSQKPPDKDHLYGHAKISFFSSGVEGALITIAGLVILAQAIYQWINGLVPHDLGKGSLLIAVALLINGALGWYLIELGRKNGSLIIESNGKHVLTDAWTSVGVLTGVVLAWWTKWDWVDPLCATLVGLHILRSGIGLLWSSTHGLMDRADPRIQAAIIETLESETKRYGITWHQLRHRHLGHGHWVDFHLVFEDETTVRDAHEQATVVEREIRKRLGPETVVTTHLEPKEDHERIHGHAPGEGELDSGLGSKQG